MGSIHSPAPPVFPREAQTTTQLAPMTFVSSTCGPIAQSVNMVSPHSAETLTLTCSFDLNFQHLVLSPLFSSLLHLFLFWDLCLSFLFIRVPTMGKLQALHHHVSASEFLFLECSLTPNTECRSSPAPLNLVFSLSLFKKFPSFFLSLETK